MTVKRTPFFVVATLYVSVGGSEISFDREVGGASARSEQSLT